MKKPSNKKSKSVPNEYYHHLVNDSSYAIIGTDSDGIVVSWNAMAERIFNTEQSQILGSHIDRIIPESRRNLVRKLIEKTVVHRQVNEFEIERVDKSGNKNTLAIAITPISDCSRVTSNFAVIDAGSPSRVKASPRIYRLNGMMPLL